MKRFALFVGISTYPDCPLKCASADAKELHRVFRSQYDATSLLLDGKATPDNIVSEIKKFQKMLSPGDMLLFYFSGHGCERNGERLLAVPTYDAKNCYLGTTGLSIQMLISMTDLKGVHRLFILDCCRSRIEDVNEVVTSGKMANYLERHSSKKLIAPIFLSSSAPGQTSYEDVDSGHGYFTEAFLSAIQNPNVISFNMFREYLDYEMGKKQTPGPQDPYFEGGIGSNLPFWPTWKTSNEDEENTPHIPNFGGEESSTGNHVELPFLLPIEDVAKIKNIGQVVTGRVERGVINVGDEVEIIGVNRTVKVKVGGIEKNLESHVFAQAGDVVGILLYVDDDEKIERGQVLTKPGYITAHTKFRAWFHMISVEEGGSATPLRNDSEPSRFLRTVYLFYIRTINVPGSIQLYDGLDAIKPGDNASIKVELIVPVALEKGMRFLVRSDNKIIGIGNVTDIIE